MEEIFFLKPWAISNLPFLHLADWFYVKNEIWKTIGFIGQFLFAARFVLQWWMSEVKNQVVVPPAFWHLSFWGSVIMLVYVLRLNDPVIISGFLFLPLLFGRNLVLLKRTPRP